MLSLKKKPGSDDGQASPAEAHNAINTYTRIVERRLKPSLDATSALRDKAFVEMAELKQMSKALDILELTQKARRDDDHATALDESGSPVPAMETRVNIGEEFYVRANIYNPEYVIIDVGLGVMVEMTPDEARTFVRERLSVLEEEASKHSSRISEIQAHLESITECLAELKIASGLTEVYDRAFGAADE